MNKCVYCVAMGGMHLGPCQRSFPPTSEIMPLSKYENLVIKNLIEEKDRRIAELEAEVERLKDQDETTYPEALKALKEMAEFIQQEERDKQIKVQTALEVGEREGEGEG